MKGVWMENLLRSAQFARLCGTTKATLRHYAQLGLLEPYEIAENGYRMYTPEQMAVFATISALQDAGFSLSEIVALGFGETDQMELRRQLEKHLASMDQRIVELQRRRMLLADAIDALPGQCEGERWERVYVPEMRFAVTRVDDMTDPDSAARAVAEHTELCERVGRGRVPELFTMYRIDAEAFRLGRFNKAFCILSACAVDDDASLDNREAFCRPAGDYIRRTFSVSVEEGSHALFDMLEQAARDLREGGIATAGDVYLQELPGVPLLAPALLSFRLSVALR